MRRTAAPASRTSFATRVLGLRYGREATALCCSSRPRCSSPAAATTHLSETTTTAADTTSARVYFLRDGKVWPVSREIDAAEDRPTALTAELAKGPTEQEKQDLGLTTEVPSDPDATYTTAALAQMVYTLTQYPTDEVG